MRKTNDQDLARAHDDSPALKERLLKLQLETARTRRQTTHTINARGRWDGPVPLSYAQERLWFLDQMGLVGAAYNRPLALRLSGALDEGALERALSELVRRHEVFRTRFGVQDGVPHQLIDPPAPLQLHRADLTALVDPQQREQQLRDWMQREQLHRFNLSEGPLIRVALLNLGSLEHALLITIHHIISDGWSIGIILRELGTLYGAYVHREASPLREPPVQYADYSIWQRQWLQGTVLKNQLQYWRQRLAGAPPQLQLPTDRPRPDVESFKGAALRFHLPVRLTKALEELARQGEATPFMVYLSAYQLLLSRWSGQQDIVVGSPIAGRKNREVEGLIGLFVNTLVLRTDVSGDLTFRKLLQRVKEVTLGAYAHQDLPFEKLVMELRPERSLTYQPIFQVGLALQNFPEEQLELTGLTWTLAHAENLTTHFELTMFLFEAPDGMFGLFEYATDLFDPPTVDRLASHFSTLLERVAADPDCPIARLSLLTEPERQQLLQWSGAQTVRLTDWDIISILEKQARSSPDATAICAADRILSYSDLNARANRLARQLYKHGVRPRERVGVYMNRSAECVVAFYAILKTGAVYVPLDVGSPRARLAEICMDADVEHIVVRNEGLPELNLSGVDYISVDDLSDGEPHGEGSEDLQLPLDLTAPAYAIYTSGSTGRPKGVLLHHLGLANVIAAQRRAFGASAQERVVQLASLSFDASVFEFMLALGAGMCLFIGSREELLPGPALTAFLRKHSVSVMTITPSALACLSRSDLPSLRIVIVVGEEFPAELARSWLSGPRVFNAYGPTETTIWATVHECSPQTLRDRVPIGRPIDNLRAYLLGPNRHLVSIGELGEIFVGGAGVALGYINRPDLTVDRFIDDPVLFGQGKVYRTGDLARWRSDGTLEFVGRSDEQIKIRGFRVEPAEIEAVLVEHPAVKQAAVLTFADASAEMRLVAYVVGSRNGARDCAPKGGPEKLRNAVVGEWEALYDETYGKQDQTSGPSFLGWNSSYTGQPIPRAQMQEWLDGTVDRIRSLRPRQVLDIGCGAGLLLQHLAPQCVIYVGTDFSAGALRTLRRWMSGRDDLQHVELLHRSALELQDFEPGSFDTVILNSVVQYFPDVDYLLAVLQGAVRLLCPGGRIFIGDVRHLGLQQMFHGAVQLSRAPATVSVGQLRKNIARAVAHDKELVVDPKLFQVLRGRSPGISTVDTRLRRGPSENELTRYRYDVILQADDRIGTEVICECLDWPAAIGSLADLEVALQHRRWPAVRLCGIPNQRLAREAAGQRLIEGSDERMEIGMLLRRLDEQPFEAVDPDQLCELAEACGYDAIVSPGDQGYFEAQLLDRAQAQRAPRAVPQLEDAAKPWSAYANDPLDDHFKRQLASELRDYLKGRLPEYMVPSAWVLLEYLPLTLSGKVDRGALPAPELGSPVQGRYAPPQSELETVLAQIWQELLQVERVGRQDNFFELGGHSLLALKVLARINQQSGSVLKGLDLYQSPTIRSLAERIQNGGASDGLVHLQQEAALDPRIVGKPGRRRAPPKAVMLTGATGFVGRFLTAQLLEDTDTTLYCLVRAGSAQHALSRLHTTMLKWDLWRDEFEHRIVAVPGDLRLPHLGMDESSYRELCRDIDSIYHCGASMNHLEPYAMAKSANVGGSKELLKFATRHTPKLINYISSLGVFGAHGIDATRIVDEHSPIDHERHLTSRGYMASKWVGEKICMLAGERGIHCNIFRLGLTWADSKQGRYDELQWGYRLIKSCLLSGYGIKNYFYEMAPTPVDYVSRAVVFLANQHSEGRGIFHISSSNEMAVGLFERCNEILDTSLTLVSFYEWIQEIKRLHQQGRTLPEVPLIEFAFSMDEAAFLEHQRTSRSAYTRFECDETHRELERAAIVAPTLDDDMIRACLESMLSRDADMRQLVDWQAGRPLLKRKSA